MEKIKVPTKTISYPMPCCLLGTKVEGRANFLAIAFFSVVAIKPTLIAASLSKNHFTNPGIRETGAFSINVPSTSMAEVTDYCGMVSGKKVDKSTEFELFSGELDGAPMIVECPYNLECKLVQTVDLPGDDLFIGEIVAAYSDERYVTDGVPDLAKMDTFVLDMPKMAYMGLGSPIGRAWSMGKARFKRP
jgi:flavin reductase (DIM6/NTAB) family NADH-FMN oxidoreductase RutF